MIKIVENYILLGFKKSKSCKLAKMIETRHIFLSNMVDKIIVQMRKIRCNMICFVLWGDVNEIKKSSISFKTTMCQMSIYT